MEEWRVVRDTPDPEWKYPDYVYFVLNRPLGLVKIGSTSFVAGRLSQLSLQVGMDLDLAAVIPAGGSRLERHFHQMFSHLATKGEWFRSAPELEAVIQDVLSEYGSRQPTEWVRILSVVERGSARRGILHAISISDFRSNWAEISRLVAVIDDDGSLLGYWRPTANFADRMEALTNLGSDL